MVFDNEDKSGAVSTLEEDASMAQIKNYMEGEEGSQSDSQAEIRNGPSPSPEKKAANSRIEWNRHQNFSSSFSRTATQIPLDRLVKQYTYELIEVMLLMTIDNFKMSRTPISNQLTQTLHLVQEKTEPNKVKEIRRQFISDGKIHF